MAGLGHYIMNPVNAPGKQVTAQVLESAIHMGNLGGVLPPDSVWLSLPDEGI